MAKRWFQGNSMVIGAAGVILMAGVGPYRVEGGGTISGMGGGVTVINSGPAFSCQNCPSNNMATNASGIPIYSPYYSSFSNSNRSSVSVHGSHWNGFGGSIFYYGWDPYPTGNVGSNTTNPPPNNDNPPPNTSTSRPPPPPTPARAPAPEPVVGDVAEVELTIPADALLWAQGIRMKQTGPVRKFVSPALKPGYSYDYELRAIYQENGREVTAVRLLRLRAGDRLEALFVALPAPASNGAVSAAQR